MSGLMRQLPVSVNVWRTFLQWLGGMGILILAVAVLPLLGVGGSQLFKAEAAGPVKDTKLTPRMTGTAKGLWGVYALFSVACASGLLAGRHGAAGCGDAHVHHREPGRAVAHDASFGHFSRRCSKPLPWSSCWWPAATLRCILWPRKGRLARFLARPGAARHAGHAHRGWPGRVAAAVGQGGVRATDGAAPRHVQCGVAGHHHGLRHGGLPRLAGVCAGADAAACRAWPPAPGLPAAASRWCACSSWSSRPAAK